MNAAASGFALSRAILRLNACNFPYNFDELCDSLMEGAHTLLSYIHNPII